MKSYFLVLVKYQQFQNCWEKSIRVVKKVNNITNNVKKPFCNKVTPTTAHVSRLKSDHSREVFVSFQCSREKRIQTEHKIKKVKFEESVLIDFVIFVIISKEYYKVTHGGFVVICEVDT